METRFVKKVKCNFAYTAWLGDWDFCRVCNYGILRLQDASWLICRQWKQQEEGRTGFEYL